MASKHLRIILFMSVFMPSLATADMDTHLNDMFQKLGMATNTTDAQAYETSRRSVLTGGSFEARAKIVRPKLIEFDPPSFKSGCNGISLHMGGISFINAQEFQDAMRAIAANSVGLLSGYAFEMAIDAMCDKCGANLKNLMNKIQSIASKLRDSCQAAKALVAALPDPKAQGEKLRHDSAILGSINNATSDVFGALESGATKLDALLTPAQKKEKTGAYTKKAVESTDLPSWFDDKAGSGLSMAEMIMNMFGSMIVQIEPGERKEYKFSEFPVMLPYDRFMNMTSYEGTELYQCNDEQCESPPKSTHYVKGFRQRVIEMLCGPSHTALSNDCDAGIIAKYRSSSLVFSPEEKQFIQALPPGVAGTISEFSNSREASKWFVASAIDYVTSRMAQVYVSYLASAVKSAISQSQLDRAKFDGVKREIDTYTREAAEAVQRHAVEMNNAQATVNAALAMREYLKQSSMNR